MDLRTSQFEWIAHENFKIFERNFINIKNLETKNIG